MWQQVIVILIIAAAAGWLGWQGVRFFRPKPTGKGCGGGCCSGDDAKPAAKSSEKPLQMISSDDIRARLSARNRN